MSSASKNYDKTQIWNEYEKKLWIFTLFIGTAILMSGRMAMAICEVDIMSEFNWNEQELGDVLSIFFWGYATSQIIGGTAADLYGGAETIAISSLLWGSICLFTPFLCKISMLLFGKNAAFYTLAFLRILMGVAQGVHFPSLSSLLSTKVSDNNKAFAMAAVSSGGQFGTLFCGYLGSKLLTSSSWKVVFVVFGAFGIAFSIFIYGLKRYKRKFTRRTIALDDLSTSPLLSSEKIFRKEEFWIRVHETIKNAVNITKFFYSKPAFIALILSHMASTTAMFIISFWLPKYFPDNFDSSKEQAWKYNVMPWLGAIPASLFSGVVADKMIKEVGFSVTKVRCWSELISLVGCALCLHPLTQVETTGFDGAMTWSMMSVMFLNVHHAGAMVNPQDIAPNHSGSVFGIMNMCGAFASAFGVWFTGYLLRTFSSNWSLVFNYVMLVNLLGGVLFFCLGTGKQLL